MQMQAATTRRSFTLVELLLAMAISALLVVSVVSAARALSGARRGVAQRAETVAAARQALATIVGELRSVRRDMLRGKPVVVGRRGDADGAGDRIDLLVLSDRRVRPEGAESDQFEVSFFLVRLPRRELPVLMCRRDHALDDDPDEGGVAAVVADGIVGLTFEYYSRGEWVGEWSEFEQTAPEAVRVIVAAVEPGPDGVRGRSRPTVLSTVVALHVNPPVAPPPPEEQRSSPEGGPRS